MYVILHYVITLLLCKVMGYNVSYLHLYVPFYVLLFLMCLGLIILNLNFSFCVVCRVYTILHNNHSSLDSLSLKTHTYVLQLE